MEHFDVLIVGAGLSGIGAAAHLKMECAGKSFAILEGRSAMGGTWDLFRYPGIRSDSDMFTLGYRFRPWTDPKAIADGPAILEYIRETAKEFKLEDTIRYNHRVVNASLDGERVVYKSDINLGIAVALEHGLIVPVVKGAGEKNILGLSRAIQDVADRARAKRLNPDEVQGGTFTITNPGTFGAQFGLPIINQPQVAILGVGAIEKRPVVIDDMIGIRLMGFLTLGYDHRLIDGAVADQFMADVKTSLENFDPSQV